MRDHKLRRALAGALIVPLLAACAGPDASSQPAAGSGTSTSTWSNAVTVDAALAENLPIEVGETEFEAADAVEVSLSGSGAQSASSAVTSADGTVTITAAGTYVLSGELAGQVVIDSSGDGVVQVVLDGVAIRSSTSAAMNVVDAGSVVVVLADDSDNALVDAKDYTDTSDQAPTAALYSSADLTIGGSGSLTVTGNHNNAIVGKDGLVIVGGDIEVTSVDDGIIGKDYLVIDGATINVEAADDGVKSDNTEDQGAGFVLIRGGDLTVAAQDDGVKGVQVLVAGGVVEVAGSTEAVEGSLIVIDAGELVLHSADDAINVSASDDSTTTDGSPGMGAMAADDSLNLVINGGAIEVWASGDGLDSNGNATITGGDVVVYGPTTQGNGALDVNGVLEISGGTLLATGSAQMMVAPSAESTQGWLATALADTASADSQLVIRNSAGQELASYSIPKEFASVVYSAADIEQGEVYTVSVAGIDTEVSAGEAPGRGEGPGGG